MASLRALWLPMLLAAAASCGDSGEANRGTQEGGDDVSGSSEGTVAPPTSTGDQGSDTVTSSSDAESGSPSTGEGQTKFDLASPDGTSCAPGLGTGGTMFSYIWIANSSQGTVSKVNTQTGDEEGRYYSYPVQGSGNPSRTSVNLLGDVAVSNREPGGITKIAAERVRCLDRNMDGQIQTSTGPNDLLPWQEDECVVWHLPLPTTQYNFGARPTAWEGGEVEIDENGCLEGNPRLWIGYRDEFTQRAVFMRLDGGSGTVLDTIDGPIWGGSSSMGPYGGAVNADGDFIVAGLNYADVIHIDAETLELTEITNIPQDKYGMSLDADGNMWVAGFEGNIHHYDFATDTWTTLPGVSTGRINGITVDRNGFAWGARSSPCGVIQVNTTSQTVVNDFIPLPGCVGPWGISTDVDGYVWVIDRDADRAFKIDPVSYAVQLEVTGLVDPYTYSDMTGSGLNLVVNPPG